jgi:dienelactone hydrolase
MRATDHRIAVAHVRRTAATVLAGVLFVAAAGGCRRRHPPDPVHDVDIVTSDFVFLKGSYFSPGKFGPGILLLHQCNMDRQAWDTLTPDLVSAGFHVLTIDQRGFGETRGTGGLADQQKAPADADAAYGYLLSKPGVDRGRVAAGGASCGVSYSADLATRHHEITALLLMSGWADDKARAYLRATPSLAVFGAAADRDTDSAAGIRAAVAASHHPESTARIVRGSAHGVAIFETDADVKPSIVKWLNARFTSHARGPAS